MAIAFLIAKNRTRQWWGWELCGGLSQDGVGTKSAKKIPEPDPLLKTWRMTPLSVRSISLCNAFKKYLKTTFLFQEAGISPGPDTERKVLNIRMGKPTTFLRVTLQYNLNSFSYTDMAIEGWYNTRVPECLSLRPNWLPPPPLPLASVSPPGTIFLPNVLLRIRFKTGFKPEVEFFDVIGTEASSFTPCYLQSPLLTFPPPPLYTETSSQKTFKIMPRNLKEILYSWIQFQVRI